MKICSFLLAVASVSSLPSVGAFSTTVRGTHGTVFRNGETPKLSTEPSVTLSTYTVAVDTVAVDSAQNDSIDLFQKDMANIVHELRCGPDLTLPGESINDVELLRFVQSVLRIKPLLPPSNLLPC